jgi:hypothetical protein
MMFCKDEEAVITVVRFVGDKRYCFFRIHLYLPSLLHVAGRNLPINRQEQALQSFCINQLRSNEAGHNDISAVRHCEN